jgi:F-type H+-transporting ATPase subunit a
LTREKRFCNTVHFPGSKPVVIRLLLPPNKIISVLGGFVLSLAVVPSAQAAINAAAEPLFHVGPLPVTNSMVTTWGISLLLIIVIRIAVGRPTLVPNRGQAFVESVVEGIMDVVTPIVGKKAVRASFPLLVCLFVFILIQNWSGLLPGVGTILSVDHETGGWKELIRPGNADANGTGALAVVSIIAWLFLILRYAGPKFILKDIFGNKADRRDTPAAIYYPLFLIFFAVGLIEIVSMVFRPISLTVRLFGNVFGGENLLHSMSAICQWGLPVPFYFLEVLIGFVQAFVFTLLVSVYIGLICNHGDDHEHEHDSAHALDPAAETAPAAH